MGGDFFLTSPADFFLVGRRFFSEAGVPLPSFRLPNSFSVVFLTCRNLDFFKNGCTLPVPSHSSSRARQFFFFSGAEDASLQARLIFLPPLFLLAFFPLGRFFW